MYEIVINDEFQFIDQTLVDMSRQKVREAFELSLKNKPREYNDHDPTAYYLRTFEWIERYVKDEAVLEPVTDLLCEMSGMSYDLDMVKNVRRFIKFSENPMYSNVSYIINFSNLLKDIIVEVKKTGSDSIDDIFYIVDHRMDELYWEADCVAVMGYKKAETNGEKQLEAYKLLNAQASEITQTMWELEEYYNENFVVKEDIPKTEVDEYKQDFLDDAKSHYAQPSIFDVLNPNRNPETEHHQQIRHVQWMKDNGF